MSTCARFVLETLGSPQITPKVFPYLVSPMILHAHGMAMAMVMAMILVNVEIRDRVQKSWG